MSMGLWCFNLSQLHPVGWGRGRVRKLTCSDKGVWQMKEKLHTQAKQNNAFVNSFLISHGQAGVGPRQMPSLQTLPALYPGMMLYGLGYPWSWLCPPSSSCTPSPCRWGEEQRSAQQSLKHPCVSSSFQHKYKMWLHQLLQRKLTLSQPNPETEKKPLWGDGVEVVNCLPFRSVQTSRIPGNFLSFSPFCHTF